MNADKLINTLRLLEKSTMLLEALEGEIHEGNEYIKWLESQLSASQARERAAVDELCDCCKRYARTVTLKTDCLNCQWHGPQDGKGEAE